MAIGGIRVADVVVASAASTSNEIDLGRGFSRILFDPTGAAGSCQFYVSPIASSSGGIYRQLKYNVTSGMSAPQTITVASAVSGSFVEVPLYGARYIKVAVSGTIANGATLKIFGADV